MPTATIAVAEVNTAAGASDSTSNRASAWASAARAISTDAGC